MHSHREPALDAFSVLWHVVNGLAPAVAVAAMAAAIAKRLWRRELQAVSWRRLSAAAAVAGATVLLAGLLAFGRDGRMATYAGMVIASAGALWWVGFGARR